MAIGNVVGKLFSGNKAEKPALPALSFASASLRSNKAAGSETLLVQDVLKNNGLAELGIGANGVRVRNHDGPAKWRDLSESEGRELRKMLESYVSDGSSGHAVQMGGLNPSLIQKFLGRLPASQQQVARATGWAGSKGGGSDPSASSNGGGWLAT